jgi:hypothetical protein
MKNYFLFFFFTQYIKCDLYTPYGGQINSIFGTGDTDIDILYRQKCESICKTCCTGDDLNSIICASLDYCKGEQSQLDLYLYTIIISVYFSILILTMVVMFVTFYLLSRKVYNNRTSLKNGTVAAMLTLMTGLILPIIVLKIIAFVKDRDMTSLLGGDFKKLDSNLVSTRIKLTERQKKYVIEESGESESRQVGVGLAATKRVLTHEGAR